MMSTITIQLLLGESPTHIDNLVQQFLSIQALDGADSIFIVLELYECISL